MLSGRVVGVVHQLRYVHVCRSGCVLGNWFQGNVYVREMFGRPKRTGRGQFAKCHFARVRSTTRTGQCELIRFVIYFVDKFLFPAMFSCFLHESSELLRVHREPA